MQATGIQIDGLFLRRATVRRKSRNLVVSDLKIQPIEDSCKADLHCTQPSLVSGLHSNDLNHSVAHIYPRQKPQAAASADPANRSAAASESGRSDHRFSIRRAGKKSDDLFNDAQRADEHLQASTISVSTPNA